MEHVERWGLLQYEQEGELYRERDGFLSDLAIVDNKCIIQKDYKTPLAYKYKSNILNNYRKENFHSNEKEQEEKVISRVPEYAPSREESSWHHDREAIKKEKAASKDGGKIQKHLSGTLEDKYLNAKQNLFDKVYGERLNPEQRRAVFTTRGPLLVLAGAGSGKTTVLVNRIAYLIKYGDAYFSDFVPDGITPEAVRALETAESFSREEISEILPQFITASTPPWRVLAITFTNKAAGEIKDRLLSTFDDKDIASSVWAGTFHSVCMRILRKHGELVGLREGFSIYDTDDKKRMISDIIKSLGYDEKTLAPRAVADAISRAKDELKGPDEMDVGYDPRGKKIIEIYRYYEKRMKEHNAVDFDDIIMKCVELLEANKGVRDYYQEKFMHVLVDEYQDTNYAQFVLTKILSDKHENIMVVGDDDQSIYRFRGATIENILNFDKTYPSATVIKLEQNYRSTSNILDAANAVISHNTDRHAKSLWCSAGSGEKITLRAAENAEGEGRYILDKISTGVRLGGKKYSDFAVLYRTNALGRALQTTFAKSGIPYKVIGDMRFYDRKEIKDMVAYLTVITTPSDNLRLKRIMNEPKRKIGSATAAAIEEIAQHEGLSMFAVMERSESYTALLKSSDKLTAFTSMINKIKEEKTLPSEILTEVFEASGYKASLVSEGFEGQGKIENVTELINGAAEYEKRCLDEDIEPTAMGFLEEISLISDVDRYDETADAVVLMTIHAAKGLEFPVVFIAGMEDGIFPSQQNIGEPSEMSEERRLAYVAITRAKEKLYITYAKERMMYGKTAYNKLSRFAKDEIPESLIDEDKPRMAPPRMTGAPDRPWQRERASGYNLSEMRRDVNISQRPTPQKKQGASGYGVEKFAPGTRISHAMFGEGVIASARDMGGDVLYEVNFDKAGTKKLMATFAKLKKI
ncbi:MAG: UvrD-helicase domain-containing protein [Clostridia bacterium]|nr:UvrD-helicase domain-containing protein [Clostridia bacterium]